MTAGPIGEPSRLKMDCNNEAGTAAFGPLIGQSNDFRGDTIYLCLNDTIPLIHNGDQVLTGDPDPTTSPGVGYSINTCPPTVSGPDLAMVATDPCLLFSVDPITGNPALVTLAGPDTTGNAVFYNNGEVQGLLNGGNPVQVWFAPITYDSLVQRTLPDGSTAYFSFYEQDMPGGVTGPCVDVNLEAQFSVVYLNAIEASNINVTEGPTGCTGSFTISGGLPEFDSGEFYQLDISLSTDPTVKGVITSSVQHGETLEFTAPVPGVYDVSIEDGKSCGAGFQINMSACAGVSFRLPYTTALPGESVCLDMKVENFTDVGSFQFTLQFDPNVIAFDSITNIVDQLASNFDFFHRVGEGRLTFSWSNAITPTSVDDDESLFSICFTVVGSLNEESPVRFGNDPTPIEIGDIDNNPYGFVSRNGLVRVSTDEIIAALVQDSVTCHGGNDGSLQVTMFDGIAPYSLTWDLRGSTPPFANGPIDIANEDEPVIINDLTAGTYVLQITDSSTPAITILDTVAVHQSEQFSVSLDIENRPSCFGDSTVAIRAIVEIAANPVANPESLFSFSWNVPGETTSSIDSLPASNYAVTVTDPKGCIQTASVGVSQPNPLVIDPVIPPLNATCSGSADGSFSVQTDGGAPFAGGYIYRWQDLLPDSTITDTMARINLNPGRYYVTVTDRNGCSQIDSVDITTPKILSFDSLVVDATCNGLDNGQLRVIGRTALRSSGGYSVIPNSLADTPYTFNWTGPNGPIAFTDTDTSSTNTNLAPGLYTVTMFDQDPAGCNTSQSFTIEEPDSLRVSVIDVINESCTVGNDGAITVAASGGTPAYQYLWSSGQTDSTLMNLTAGDYSLTVTDANSCQDSFSVTLTAPLPPQIDPIATDTVSCTTSTDGTLTVSAQPGNADITGYAWSNGSTQTTINNLSPGAYIVSVTAADGCVAVDTGYVVTPPPIQLDSLRLTSPLCPGQANGSITVFASGGTPPYSYTWQSPNGNTSTSAFNLFPGLSAGEYQLTITDANDCDPFVTSITLEDPPSIDVTFSGVVGVSCFEGVSDGQATATALYSDGTSGDFTFVWETGEVFTDVGSSMVNALSRGPQEVVVSDANMCSTVATVDIPSPEEVLVSVNTEQPSCNGLSDGSIRLSVSGGTGPFSFQWQEVSSTTAQVADIPAGTYSALIIDSRGCLKTQIVELSEPDELMVRIDSLNSQLNVSCNGDADARVTLAYNSEDNVNPLGPNPYAWSDGIGSANSPVATDLAPGVYSVTLTDENGCEDELTFNIGSPQPILFSLDPIQPPLCFGDPTLLSIDTITGGSGSSFFDYTYMVDNNGFSFLPDQDATIFAGSHVVTVEDPAGCTESLTVEVTQPRPISVSFDSTVVVVELGDSTTQLNPIVVSDLPIAQYRWTPATGLSSDTVRSPIVIPPESLDYTIVVTDINGCTGDASVFVELDVNRNVYIPNAFAPEGEQFLNQQFRLFSCAGVRMVKSVTLFDRWGDLLYQANDLAPNCQDGSPLWDGRYNGRLMNPGVYVYLIEIEFEDDITLLYRGDVTLIR